jgi:hypothetical protein
MSDHSTSVTHRRGIALMSVLYFLVVCALTSTAVLFARRSATRSTTTSTSGAQLLSAADAAVYFALGAWDPAARAAQVVGSTVTVSAPASTGVNTTIYVTRVTPRLFSIVGEAHARLGGASRRVNLLVRLPGIAPAPGALIAAVGITIGKDVRFVDDTGCADSAAPMVMLAPSAALKVDSAASIDTSRLVTRDSAAADSAAYLQVGGAWWNDLVQRADIRLASDAHVTPSPSVVANVCVPNDANWGDPTVPSSACAPRAPLVYAAGDLTIDGGVGQGALLVDGRLSIAGPFTYSGQIVARRGIETLSDNIAISGGVYAWSASSKVSASRATTNDVILAHAMTLRRSRCDAGHGVASWLQPHRVRERAWSELF